MNSSLRWGLGVLASLALQVGCCSIHVDYAAPHGRPVPSSMGDACCEDSECGINGLHFIGHRLASLHNQVACSTHCSSGCGEVYWDEYINEPPVCDPCGCNNEWVGGCGHCRPWYSRLRDLWGYRYMPADCSSCSSCSSAGSVHEGVVIGSGTHEHVVSPSIPSQNKGIPTPAKPKKDSPVVPPAEEVVPQVPASKSNSGMRRVTPDGSVAQRGERVKTDMARTSVERKVPAKTVSGRRPLTTQTR
jgi:hypothetical protein